jgi:excisionase family DNA binding protein
MKRGKVPRPIGNSIDGPQLFFDKQPIDPGPALALLTVVEAAGRLKISVPGMRRLQQCRLIPFIKVGGSIRFAISDIASYVAKHRVDSTDQ